MICIDFIKLNAHIRKDKIPILMIEDILDELPGANFFH